MEVLVCKIQRIKGINNFDFMTLDIEKRRRVED